MMRGVQAVGSVARGLVRSGVPGSGVQAVRSVARGLARSGVPGSGVRLAHHGRGGTGEEDLRSLAERLRDFNEAIAAIEHRSNEDGNDHEGGEDDARERMLQRLTNETLRNLCKELNVTVRSNAVKSVLVQALLALDPPIKEELVQALVEERYPNKPFGTSRPAHPERSAVPAAAIPPRVLTCEALGVGGLELEVAQLQTRIWLPHVAPAEVSARLDVSPPLGLLLHGPPGCGKSLLAVRLARCLSPRPPRIVKGELSYTQRGRER